jgi:SAM-dependent methyltransferase
MTCPICGTAEMRRDNEYAHCRACGYWSADLVADVENIAAPDQEYELVSYEHTRKANYLAILELLAKRHPRGSRLLEIGCADGLFLELASTRHGYDATGIEPNLKMINGNPFGQDIRQGFFPDALAGSDERFDIIALNCVFEHVPDIDGMIETFKRYLAPDGSLVLNVPVSSGLMFRVARRLHALRVRFAFDRIWQKGFVSPHLHYFATKNLAALFARHQMQLVAERGLALFSLGGINARLSLDPNIRVAQRVSALGFLLLYYPISRIVPDARVYIFESRRLS